MTRTIGSLEHELERTQNDALSAYKERNALRAELAQAVEVIRGLRAQIELLPAAAGQAIAGGSVSSPAEPIAGLGPAAAAAAFPVRPVEHYVRTSVGIYGGSVEAGIWYEPGEPTAPLRSKLREVIETAALGVSLRGEGSVRCSARIEQSLGQLWPGRPFFVEIWNEHDGLTQVYAPCGMPRSR